jgi:hypothetical protein
MYYIAKRSDSGILRYAWAEDPAADCARLGAEHAFTVDVQIIFVEPPPHSKPAGWYDTTVGDLLWQLCWKDWRGEPDYTEGSEVDSYEGPAEPWLEACSKAEASPVQVVKERLSKEKYQEVLETCKKSFTAQNGKQVRVFTREGVYLRVRP